MRADLRVVALLAALAAGGARATRLAPQAKRAAQPTSRAVAAPVAAHAGGVGGSKRLLAKVRRSLLAPTAGVSERARGSQPKRASSATIVIDGTNVRGHLGFRHSERELLELIVDWVASEPSAEGNVVVVWDATAAHAAAAAAAGPADETAEGAAVLVARSALGESADELIVRTVAALLVEQPAAAGGGSSGGPRDVVLVSADTKLLRQCGAECSEALGRLSPSARKTAGGELRAVHPSAFAALIRRQQPPPPPADAPAEGERAGASAATPAAPPATQRAASALASAVAAARARAPPRSSLTMRADDGGASRARRAAAVVAPPSAADEWVWARGGSALVERPAFLPLMFLAGGLLGPWLDGFHGAFGVLAYSPPLAVALPVGGLAAGHLSAGLLRTAVWVPPLFGVAGALIGALYVGLDAAAPSPPARPPLESVVLAAIGCFTLQYWLSGALWANGCTPPLLYASLAASAYASWRCFDATRVGLVVALLTGVGGPMIEVALVNGPQSLHADWSLYAYAQPDLPLLGINGWIAPVYFAGAPAVGGLARWVKGQLSGAPLSGAPLDRSD